MPRFRFRLQGLLRLRTQLEQVARRSLATAMGAVAGVEQRIAVADAGLRECEQLGCTNEPQAPLARALGQGLQRHRSQLQHQLRAAEAQLDRARGDWLERRREQRALASLRERRHGEWRRDDERRDQRDIEETSRHRVALDGPQEERT